MAADPGEPRPPLRLAILVENLRIARWQADALDALPTGTVFIVYSRAVRAGRPGHGLYRALRRCALMRLMPVGDALPHAEAVRDLDAADLAGAIERDRPDAILAFGAPPAGPLPAPLLVFDHGLAPGFDETVRGRATIGQLVRGPAPLAAGETKVHPHSYRATIAEAHRHARFLLPAAIANARAGRTIDPGFEASASPLPGNVAVLRLVARMAWRKIARLAYGAFVLKEWRVSTAPAVPGAATALPPPEAWRTWPIPAGYRFLADPFFHPSGDGILAEAMGGRSGKGEILHVSAVGAVSLSHPARHHSYPVPVEEDGVQYLLPEIADWSPPRLFCLGAGTMTDAGPLEFARAEGGLLDPTPFRSAEGWFLFASRADEGNNVLRLWWSERLRGPYREHPASPIRVSPFGARMGGPLFEADGVPIRPGQDFSRRYGDGLALFRIEALSRADYREVPAGLLRFAGVRGPHTLSFGGGEALFDWYRERFTPWAGAQRLRALLVRRG